MQIIIDAYKKTKSLHHAYLIEGNEDVYARVRFFIEKDLNMPVRGNPDVWCGVFEKFGINEGRGLRDLQSNKPISGSKRIFVVVTQFFTNEAQNSLLKVFEDPTPDTHFFIITPSADVLLPTLRSRFFIVERDKVDLSLASGTKDNASLFLSGDIKERIDIIAPIINSKDKREALQLLDAMEAVMLKKGDKIILRAYKDILSDIIDCRKYLHKNAPSVKMILEHLAITTPRLNI